MRPKHEQRFCDTCGTPIEYRNISGRCAAHYDRRITMTDLCGPSRRAHLVRVRQIVSLLAIQAGHSRPTIGRALGDRDHSTVIHAYEVAKHRVKIDAEFAQLVRLVASGEMPDAVVAEEPVVDEIIDDGEECEADAPATARKLGPNCADILQRIEARRAPRRRVMAKNDFRAESDEDDSHRFHAGIAAGSRALLAAINLARAA